MRCAYDRRQRGFTLIEISLVLIVSGLVMLIASQALKLQNTNTKRAITLDSLNVTRDALIEFVALQGRYPCPADITLDLHDANYGRENVDGSGNCIGTTVTGRDADGDGTADPIVIGGVPFNTMLDPDLDPATIDGVENVPLNATETIDGWGHKLTYAVTKSLTKVTTYNDFNGALRIRDENDQDVIDPADSAHLILISHGDDGVGSFTQEGKLVEPCNAGVVIPPPPPPAVQSPLNEKENCDEDDGTFLSGLRNSSDHSYNDDLVQFVLLQTSNLWTITGTVTLPGPPPVTIFKVANTNTGNVGIGTDQPGVRLDVAGSIQGFKLQTANLCDAGGINCMAPSVIGGTDPNMDCTNTGGSAVNPGPHRAVTAIEQNHVVCADIFAGAPAATPNSCPAGQLARGISNLGNVLCAAP